MSRVPERSASAVALSIVTREGKPVYLKSFEPKDEIKYHFIIHAALDYFDEKQAQEKSRSALMLPHARLDGICGRLCCVTCVVD